MMLVDLRGYTCLQKPYAFFATDEVHDEIAAAAKEAKATGFVVKKQKYQLLFASIDACEEHLLSTESANILGHANEALTKQGLPITSQANMRKNLNASFEGGKMEKLPLLQRVKRHIKAIARDSKCPTPGGMFNTLLRYARNPTTHQQNLQLGANSLGGVANEQQAACAAAVASREIKYAILPALEPAARLSLNGVVKNNPNVHAFVLFDAFPMNAKVVTTGGWGCIPHRDRQDAGGGAFIIQYGLGDLSSIKGGFMCFPQFRTYCSIGACTVHFIRTASVMHNTLPHTPTDTGRVVGTSLHMNKGFLFNSNAAINANGVESQAYLDYVNEEKIEAGTKENYLEIDRLLKHTDWSGKLA